MKNIKTVTAFILALAFVFSLCSCSITTTTDDEDGKTEVTTSEKSDTQKETDEETVNYEISDTSFEIKESYGMKSYYGIVEITNTGNCNLYLDEAVFDIEDNNGHLLMSDDYISSAPEVIAPGEKGYFYNTSSVDDDVDMSNGAQLVPQLTVEKATEEFTNLEVTDTDMREDDFGSPTVTGRVTNTTDEDIDYIYINVLFYDAEGKTVGITGTSVTDLKAGNKTSFECSGWFSSGENDAVNIADYKVIAQTTYFQW